MLTKLASIASGGTKPISIAVHGDAVYVLNYGNVNAATVNGNITGFKIPGDTLVAIPASTQPLSGTGDVHPTDIVFTPDGKYLVVAERFGPTAQHLGKLDTFAVIADVAQAGHVPDARRATSRSRSTSRPRATCSSPRSATRWRTARPRARTRSRAPAC